MLRGAGGEAEERTSGGLLPERFAQIDFSGSGPSEAILGLLSSLMSKLLQEVTAFLQTSLAPVFPDEADRALGDELLVVVQGGDVVGVLEAYEFFVLAVEPFEDVRAVLRGDDVIFEGL